MEIKNKKYLMKTYNLNESTVDQILKDYRVQVEEHITEVVKLMTVLGYGEQGNIMMNQNGQTKNFMFMQ